MVCKATNKSGKPCKAHAMNDSEYCYLHNPEIKASEKLSARSNGGKSIAHNKSNTIGTITLKSSSDVVTLLSKTINAVLTNEIDVKRANSIGFLSNHLLKAIEVSDLEQRLIKLEEHHETKRTN